MSQSDIAYDYRILIKPPSAHDRSWIINVQSQSRERAAWEGFAQASGASLAKALRATADLIDARPVAPACHTCGLVDPGPEHQGYEPMLCSDRALR